MFTGIHHTVCSQGPGLLLPKLAACGSSPTPPFQALQLRLASPAASARRDKSLQLHAAAELGTLPEVAPHHATEPVDTSYQHSLLHYRSSYEEMYKESIEQPARFWAKIARQYHWEHPFAEDHHSSNLDVRKGKIEHTWFRGGRTSICYNALDRHVKEGRGDVPCFLWEGNQPTDTRSMTYKQVLDEVCRVANWLKSIGVKKGDAVAMYMPAIETLPICMLACSRIGAIHSVIFGGFSSESLASRMVDCKAKVLLTATGSMRGKKPIYLKQIADEGIDIAAQQGFEVERVLVYDNSTSVKLADVAFVEGRDVHWEDAIPSQSTECDVEWMDAEDPLFLLYTSGSTGKPKGVLHTTGGYMVMAGTTTRYSFDLQPADVWWCTADPGWITGHTYLAYGPLLCNASCVIYEGVPSYPTPARCWEIVENFKVKQFYTAPTLIRALIGAGDQYVSGHDKSSLRVLGSVGEPINPVAWHWFHKNVGEERCPISDTWWQTETGAHMISPLPGVWPQKPGSASLPFFGIDPVLVNDKGEELHGPAEGFLCIRNSWPSVLRTIYGDRNRYETTYFAPFKGYYFSGDGARRDEDGYYWITGRVDDVINVSGHRIGTAEVEGALEEHPACSEAAVVGFEHPVKGQGIYAYVSLKDGEQPSEALKKEMVSTVRKEIGAFASPDVIHWAPGLPKTRSGKIMRRVLRKIATKEEDQLGDTSTLADPNVVESLLANRP